MEPLGIDIPTNGDLIVIGQDANGVPSLLSDPLRGALQDAANNAWADLRSTLPDLLRRELGKGDRFADGFTLYDIDVRLSPLPQITVQRNAAGDLVVHVLTGRNTVIATTTQPTFLGSYADPRFSLDFGLSFDYVIDIPPVAGPLGGSKILNPRFLEPHLDSQNFAGDLLLAIANIVTFFAGTSVDELLDAAAREHLGEAAINDQLGPINQQIQSYLDAGYNYLTLMGGDPQDLMRQLGPNAGAIANVINSLPSGTQSLMLVCRQPDRSGVVEGEISWQEGSGRPLDEAAFRVATSIASAYLPQTAMSALESLSQHREMEPIAVAEPAGITVEQVRLANVAGSLAAAPAAANLEQSALGAAGGGVRLWDAAAQAEPPTAPPLGFEGVDLAATTWQLRAIAPEAYETIMDVFRRGPQQFVVRCTVAEPGGGTHETGHMVAMWHDTSDGWERRRFRLEGVETEQALSVTCALAPDWRWFPGSVREISPRNWSGAVTVRKARPMSDMIREGLLQVSVLQRDGSRRTVPVSVLEAAGALPQPSGGERSIIIVSGTPGDEASLNPQPLPPKWRQRMFEQHGQEQAIILAGGAPGDEAALNPQPLPPRWREELARGVDVQVNPQPLPPREIPGSVLGPGGDAMLNPQPLPPRGIPGSVLRRGPSVFLRQFDRVGDVVQRLGRHVVRQEELVAVAVSPAVQSAVRTEVDHFGDLVAKEIDIDILIPDTENPTGYGTVRGVDFRVWPQE